MSSIMAREALSTPAIIQHQIQANQPVIENLVQEIKARDIKMIMMVGRGSSDHAGVFAKYLFEVELGIPVCFAAPSVGGVYKKTLTLENTLAIIISQSGKSPDLLNQTRAIQAAGAYCVALVNDGFSPLAAMADAVLQVRAEEELAVAATKSYLATLSALLHLTAVWKQDEILLNDLHKLPEALGHVCEGQGQLKSEFLRGLRHCVVLGRGFGYAIAREIALKLKEVCSIHAEAFSSAEFIHGPVTLVENELAVISVDIQDESHQVHQEQVNNVSHRGARMATLTHHASALSPRLLPLLVMLRFYLDVEQVAQTMGMNPDAPPGLKKVTETH